MTKDPLEGDRDHSHATENGNLKSDQPPRPATEPDGAEGSSESHGTLTDPATGQPNHKRADTQKT